MRILIQHRETKKFFQNRKTWTTDVSKARSFPSALSAFYFASENDLYDVEMVLANSTDSSVRSIVGSGQTRSYVSLASEESHRYRTLVQYSER